MQSTKGNKVKNTETITEEKLASSWKELLKYYDSKGEISLYATLSKYEPKVVDENHIEIIYDNKSQYQAINFEKSEILVRLRKELNNDGLQLKLTISDKKYQRAYTPSEKLEKMIEKNPSINSLKEKLDLDIN